MVPLFRGSLVRTHRLMRFIVSQMLFGSLLGAARKGGRHSVRSFLTLGSKASRWLIFLALCLLSTQTAIAAPFVYGTSYDAKNVYVVDVATNTAGTGITVGTQPTGIVITPDGTKAYVCISSNNTVVPITLTSGAVGTAITVGSGPWCLAITPDGTTAYACSRLGTTVTPINLISGTKGTAITVGSPYFISITPDGTKAYVSNYGSNTVTPITLSTAAVGTAITVGTGPWNSAITPDGKKVYVCNYGSNTVTPIDITTDTANTAIVVGTQPNAIAITPDGTTAWVGTFGTTPTVRPITIVSGSVGTAISITSGYPNDIAITPDGTKAYVACWSSNRFVPINLISNTAGTAITVGNSSNCCIAAPDQAPTAIFTSSVNGSTVFFDGSGSSSPLGTIATYAWNFGDGQTGSGSTSKVSHTYRVGGQYAATLTVTNSSGTSTTKVFTGRTMSRNGGTSAQSSQTLSVATVPYGIIATPDQAPTASFTTSAGRSTLFFDGSLSSSSVGSIASYTWDFGDGTPPVTTTGPTTFHIYSKGKLVTDPLTAAKTGRARAEEKEDLDPEARLWRAVVVGDGGDPVIVNVPSDEVEVTPVHWDSGNARIAVTPDGTKAIGVSPSRSEVVLLDLTQPVITSEIVPGFEHPYSIAVTPDGTRALVTDTNRGVGIVNLLASPIEVESWVDLYYAPFDEAITPDGKTALVTTPWDADNLFAVLRIDQEVTLAYNIPRSDGYNHSITNITVTPDGTKALATDTYLSALLVLDLTQSPFAYEDKVSVGGGPQGLAVTPDGKMAVVVNSWDNTLSVLDLLASPISPGYTVSAPAGANEVAIAPDGKRAYVACGAPTYAIAAFDLTQTPILLVDEVRLKPLQPYGIAITGR